MAENESLDLGRTPRWQKVHRAVIGGEPSDQVADKARVSLYRTVRALKKLIPFDQLLSVACNDPDALLDAIRRCDKGHEFAQLFQVVAEKGQSREGLLQTYLWTLCDKYLDQIAAKSFPSEKWPSLPDLRCHLAEVREILKDDIDRIAHKMADNPDWRPRMRPSRNGSGSSTTQALLNESLLGVPSK
jgi:hypothetical protein